MIIDKVKSLDNTPIRKVIDGRLKEFDYFLSDKASNEDLFLELAFCLMTANFQAEKSLIIQKELGEGFLTMSEDELAKKLKFMGHRFWPQRAERIVLARKHLPHIKRIINEKSGLELRDWFVDNVKGLGLKESSHFLRNIGFRDYAIVDFHIIDILNEHKMLEGSGIVRKKGLNKNRYLLVEKVLRELASKLNMSLSELDLCLWYLETGKVLK
ncbi:MAG: N-glycosylase/DNA lyase [Nanoarchaeota archaeon]